MFKLYYLTLICLFVCTLYHQVTDAAPTVNSTGLVEADEPIMNATTAPKTYLGVIPKFDCAKPREISLQARTDAIHAMHDHYKRGEWGQKCYASGWCVDARNLNGWNSPTDCMSQLRYKLIECLQQNMGDGYVEQQAGFAARCMMHYWCKGC